MTIDCDSGYAVTDSEGLILAVIVYLSLDLAQTVARRLQEITGAPTLLHSFVIGSGIPPTIGMTMNTAGSHRF